MRSGVPPAENNISKDKITGDEQEEAYVGHRSLGRQCLKEMVLT
jgi:hypothetical protein